MLIAAFTIASRRPTFISAPMSLLHELSHIFQSVLDHERPRASRPAAGVRNRTKRRALFATAWRVLRGSRQPCHGRFWIATASAGGGWAAAKRQEPDGTGRVVGLRLTPLRALPHVGRARGRLTPCPNVRGLVGGRVGAGGWAENFSRRAGDPLTAPSCTAP
jgi:hypothetical protein